MAVFWDVSLCNLKETDRRLRGTCCLLYQAYHSGTEATAIRMEVVTDFLFASIKWQIC